MGKNFKELKEEYPEATEKSFVFFGQNAPLGETTIARCLKARMAMGEGAAKDSDPRDAPHEHHVAEVHGQNAGGQRPFSTNLGDPP